MLWKVITDYPKYEVSSCGQVRNTTTGRLLKPNSVAGYNRYCLQDKGRKSYYSAHRLVAIYFLPNPLNLPQVNHIDCNKFNNDVSNLEWCSSQQNMRHAWDNDLMVNVPKPPVKQRKLHMLRAPDGEVSNFDIVELAEKLGVGRGKFYQVARGTRKQHCGYTKP